EAAAEDPHGDVDLAGEERRERGAEADVEGRHGMARTSLATKRAPATRPGASGAIPSRYARKGAWARDGAETRSRCPARCPSPSRRPRNASRRRLGASPLVCLGALWVGPSSNTNYMHSQ